MSGTTTQWVARVEAESRARLEAVAALQEDLASARGTGTSADRSATVTVGTTGALVDVRFAEGATRLTPEQLRDVVLEAAARAQQDVAATVARLTEDLPGAADIRDLVAGQVPERTRTALRTELERRRQEQA